MEFKRRRYNKYIEHENCFEVILTNKKNEIAGIVLIDKEDKEKCEKYQWRLNACGTNTAYAAAHYIDKDGKDKTIPMHRYIMSYNGNLQIDHINRNGLDNRKQNLRIVRHTINNLNKTTKGTKNISGYYMSRFQADGKLFNLGYYATEKEASYIAEISKQKYIKNKEEFLLDYNLIKEIDSLPNPKRNIVKTPCGHYAVKYLYKKRTIYVGTYKNIYEAQIARDNFESERDSYNDGKCAFYEHYLKQFI